MLLGLWACTPDAEDSLTTTPVDPDDCLVKASASSGAIIVGTYIVVMK